MPCGTIPATAVDLYSHYTSHPSNIARSGGVPQGWPINARDRPNNEWGRNVMTARFGRIQLDRITSEWEEGHPINPRLLAGEVAALLRTLAPADHPIHETYASAILSATPGGCVVTYSALADYFESASAGRPAATITTSAGPVPGAAVLIWRQWLHTLAEEAAKRAALVAGFAIPANDSPGAAAAANGSPVARQADQPPPPSGSEPGYAAMRQAQQRREGERSAAEQLDAERIARQRAERGEAEKDAIIATLRAQLQAAREEAESQLRARIESDRAHAGLVERLREHAGIIEFMNPDNPLSPEQGRRMVAAWCELTESGTIDPVTETGIGLGELARRWWLDHFGEPRRIVLKHLQWALTWPARKKGGMVARRQREKG